MPVSLSKNTKKGESQAGTYIPETQTVREGGVIKKVSVDAIHRIYDQEPDFEGLVDQSVLNSAPSGVGIHLDQQDNVAPVRSYDTDLELYQRTSGVNIHATINQAIDTIVTENRECYNDGWEREQDFVEATVALVIARYDFQKVDVIEAIKTR